MSYRRSVWRTHLIRTAGQILSTVIGFCAIQQLQAPIHVSIDERPYIESRFERVVNAIAAAENCPANPGCLRAKDGSYPRFESIEAGMKRLRHEVDRRRGRTARWILNDFNRGGTPGYADYVLRIAKMSGEEIIR